MLVVNKLRGGLKVAAVDLVTKGIIDPTKGCSSGPAECSVDRRASDHRGNHGHRKAEEGRLPPASIRALRPRQTALCLSPFTALVPPLVHDHPGGY
jgi:hypothetical protein